MTDFYRAVVLQIAQDFISDQASAPAHLYTAQWTAERLWTTFLANDMPVDALIRVRRRSRDLSQAETNGEIKKNIKVHDEETFWWRSGVYSRGGSGVKFLSLKF